MVSRCQRAMHSNPKAPLPPWAFWRCGTLDLECRAFAIVHGLRARSPHCFLSSCSWLRPVALVQHRMWVQSPYCRVRLRSRGEAGSHLQWSPPHLYFRLPLSPRTARLAAPMGLLLEPPQSRRTTPPTRRRTRAPGQGEHRCSRFALNWSPHRWIAASRGWGVAVLMQLRKAALSGGLTVVGSA